MFCTLVWTARFLSAIGAMNWGLVAFFNVNLVVRTSQMLGINNLDKILYAVIGLSGVFSLVSMFVSM